MMASCMLVHLGPLEIWKAYYVSRPIFSARNCFRGCADVLLEFGVPRYNSIHTRYRYCAFQEYLLMVIDSMEEGSSATCTCTNRANMR